MNADGWGKKLHKRHVETIKRFYYQRGWSTGRLAERYQVTHSNISQIIHKRIWKVVNG